MKHEADTSWKLSYFCFLKTKFWNLVDELNVIVRIL